MKELCQRIRQAACAGAVLLLATSLGQAQSVIVDVGLGTQVGTMSIPAVINGQLQTAAWPILGGALLKVNPNGKRIMLSDFGNPSQGPIGGGALRAVAWMSSSTQQTIYALDSFAGTLGRGALFTVDPTTGHRSILSDFGTWSQGPVGKTQTGLVIVNRPLNTGFDIYVIDQFAGIHGNGAIFKVDPATGIRSIFSDFGDSSQGPIGSNPISVALAPAGLMGINPVLLVLNKGAGIHGVDGVFAVDENGDRTILSNLGDSSLGPVSPSAQGVSVVPGSQGLGTSIYVTDDQAGTGRLGALMRINPQNGTRTMVSNFGDISEGSLGDDIGGIASVSSSGNFLVTDDFLTSSPTRAMLFSVAAGTGQRTVLTDCSDTTLGPCSKPIAVISLR
jgi:hypothetical protein